MPTYQIAIVLEEVVSHGGGSPEGVKRIVSGVIDPALLRAHLDGEDRVYEDGTFGVVDEGLAQDVFMQFAVRELF